MPDGQPHRAKQGEPRAAIRTPGEASSRPDDRRGRHRAGDARSRLRRRRRRRQHQHHHRRGDDHCRWRDHDRWRRDHDRRRRQRARHRPRTRPYRAARCGSASRPTPTAGCPPSCSATRPARSGPRRCFETITSVDPEGVVHPYLAESIEPNDDYTVWTIKVRPGVTFHDGEALDAAAVVKSLQRNAVTGFVGSAVANIVGGGPGNPAEGVGIKAIDDMTVEVTMKTPWVDFPYYMASQIGMIGSPVWYDKVFANPAAPDAVAGASPVGTRPVRLRVVAAGRHPRGEEEPELLAPGRRRQRPPVPRRHRVPGHRRRAHQGQRPRVGRARHDAHRQRREHQEVPRQRRLHLPRAERAGRDRPHPVARRARKARRCRTSGCAAVWPPPSSRT